MDMSEEFLTKIIEESGIDPEKLEGVPEDQKLNYILFLKIEEKVEKNTEAVAALYEEVGTMAEAVVALSEAPAPAPEPETEVQATKKAKAAPVAVEQPTQIQSGGSVKAQDINKSNQVVSGGVSKISFQDRESVAAEARAIEHRLNKAASTSGGTAVQRTGADSLLSVQGQPQAATQQAPQSTPQQTASQPNRGVTFGT